MVLAALLSACADSASQAAGAGADASTPPRDAAAGECGPGARYVPAGSFVMGDDSTGGWSNPQHRVTLSGFCLAVREVTTREYATCVAARACPVPSQPIGDPDARCNWNIAGRENHPINCVLWSEADAYCRWIGASLPTEAQWERAARSTDQRLFPWGNDAASERACVATGSTCEVGAHPRDVSSEGILDMAGNVTEWVRDGEYLYTLRDDAGAPWVDPVGPSGLATHMHRGADYSRSAVEPLWWRFAADAPIAGVGLGFRCTRANPYVDAPP